LPLTSEEKAWEYITGSSVYSSPTIADGYVHVEAMMRRCTACTPRPERKPGNMRPVTGLVHHRQLLKGTFILEAMMENIYYFSLRTPPFGPELMAEGRSLR